MMTKVDVFRILLTALTTRIPACKALWLWSLQHATHGIGLYQPLAYKYRHQVNSKQYSILLRASALIFQFGETCRVKMFHKLTLMLLVLTVATAFSLPFGLQDIRENGKD
jgi:hypothetical protein